MVGGRNHWDGPDQWARLGMIGISAILIWLPRKADQNGRGRCKKCDYNLTGNQSGICPECGLPIPPPPYDAEDIARKLAAIESQA